MTKLPAGPATRLLAAANLHLGTPLEAPASALIEEVLEELAARNAVADQLLLLAAALPARERVWWACLAARDLPAPDTRGAGRSLAAAEAWVFKPGDDTRAAAMATLDHARPSDETTHCALAVAYHDGTLGPGDLAQHPAPPGAAVLAAFAMNLVALGAHGDDYNGYAARLVARAVDIAQGGNGQPRTPAEPEGT